MESRVYLRGRSVALGTFIFLVVLLTYSSTLNSVWATDHTESYLELDYAIWANHSFALGKVGSFVPNSVDTFPYRGNYYSAFPPGLAVLSLPFVIPGFILDGQFTEFGYALLFSELSVAVLNALAALLLYKLARLYFLPRTSAFLAFAYAFSTISWPFATFFFQNDVSATFDLAAVYLVLKGVRGGFANRFLLFAGLSVGVALTVDYVNVLLAPVLLAYLLLTMGGSGLSRRLKSASLLLLGSAAGVAAFAFYNYQSFGQAITTPEQLYLGSSTPFGNFSTPLPLGILLNLFTPYRGLFLYSPILAIGVLGFARMLRHTGSVRKEGLLLLVVFFSLFLPYCAWYAPDGGISFGPRFVIASIPFLLLPAGYVMEMGTRRHITAAYLLYSIGALINGSAALTSAIADTGSWLSSPLIYSTLPNLASGALDQLWKPSLGTLWPVGAGLILSVALLTPALLYGLPRKVPPQSQIPNPRALGLSEHDRGV